MSDNDSQASSDRTRISVVVPDPLIERIEEHDEYYMSIPELVRESIRWRLCFEADDDDDDMY